MIRNRDRKPASGGEFEAAEPILSRVSAMTWPPSRECAEREFRSLSEALRESAGDEPMDWRQLAALVEREWGPTSGARVRVALRELARSGALRRESTGYVRPIEDES